MTNQQAPPLSVSDTLCAHLARVFGRMELLLSCGVERISANKATLSGASCAAAHQVVLSVERRESDGALVVTSPAHPVHEEILFEATSSIDPPATDTDSRWADVIVTLINYVMKGGSE